MRKLVIATAILFGGIVWACSPTIQNVASLIYNLQQLPPDQQENAYTVRLYGNQAGYTGYGHYSLTFRYACVREVPFPPSLALRKSPRTPGPGPGACYVQVIDWGAEPLGHDLTSEHCAALGALLGIALE